MSRVSSSEPPLPQSQACGDRLDSWKEVAAYLKRGVSTVQRWEQGEGLPVHRHQHGRGGSVYAYRAELDHWLAGRRGTPSADGVNGPVHRRMFGAAAVVVAALAAAAVWSARGSDRTTASAARIASTTVDPDAYQAFVRGRYFRDRRMAGGCVEAEPLYERAIALSPAFAPPHADLAFCYGFDRLQGRLAPGDAASRARRAGARALELDPSLADAHVALALVEHRIAYDWTSAEQGFQRALRLDPSHVDGLVFFGELMVAFHRGDEGLEMLRRSLALQPLHIGHNVGLGFALYTLRRYHAAVEQLTQTLALDPSWAKTRFWLAESYAAAGATDAAAKEYLAWLRLTLRPERAASVIARLTQAFDSGGLQGFWKEELAVARDETAGRGGVWQVHDADTSWPYMMARRYARVGDRQRALDALHAAYEQRSHLLVFMDGEPLFDSLRSDPRYQGLACQVGPPSQSDEVGGPGTSWQRPATSCRPDGYRLR